MRPNPKTELLPLATLRQKLEQQQADLEKLLSNRDSLRIENSADELEQTEALNRRDIHLRAQHRQRLTLSEVRDALARLDEGSYGICLECEELIHPRRLAALPSAPLCLPCQEKADQQATHPFGESPMWEPLLHSL